MEGESHPPIPVSEALRIIQKSCIPPVAETRYLSDAMNRILAEEIRADRDFPPFNRSAVDGFAVRSADLLDACESFRIIGSVLAGTNAPFTPQRGDCVRIMTGAPVPTGFDSVIMVEHSREENGHVSFDKRKIDPWTNVSRRGEDATRDTLLAPIGIPVDPSLAPVAASCGKDTLQVYRAPTVSLITTGDELVRPDRIVLEHQIRDSNSSSIEILLKNFSIPLRTRRLIPDSKAELREAIAEGLGSDLLIVTGGVSMGVADFVPEILAELGVRKIFHKVKVKPGLPLWFGKSDSGSVVFGLPGNPVSAQVSFRIFVGAYIRRFMGYPDEPPLLLPLASDRIKKHEREEYTQARLVRKEGRTVVEPIRHNGSGDFVHLLGSDGIMVHPADVRELKAGEIVGFHFWRHL